MTSEMYIRIYRKIWATIRHDLYELVQHKKKAIGCNGPLPAKEFGECYNESHKKFEEVRRDIYELLMEEKIPNEGVARKIMQKAYVTYATIATDSSGKVMEGRSRWADLVNQAASQHSSYIKDFEKDQFYSNIGNDPRTTQDADEKVDISGLPNYQANQLKSQKTFSVQKDEKELEKKSITPAAAK